MKEQKYLYETTIKKLVEEKVTEQRTENGAEISVTKSVKKLKPVKLAILKPNRRLSEQAEIFYAKTLASFIKEGLLPYSLVAKRYANDGGPLSEPEKEKLDKLKNEALSLEKRYFDIANLTDEKSLEEKKEILVKLNKINEEVSKVQDVYADIFENTAEVKARNRVIDWWTLHLAHIDEDGKGYRPVFGEGNYDQRLDKFDELEESGDPYTIDVNRRSGYLTSFWFAAKNTASILDFSSVEKVFDDTLCLYHPKEDEEAPAEPKPEVKPEA